MSCSGRNHYEYHRKEPAGTLPRSLYLTRTCPKCFYTEPASSELVTIDELAAEVAKKLLDETLRRPTEPPPMSLRFFGATKKRTIQCASQAAALEFLSAGCYFTDDERTAFRRGELGIELIWPTEDDAWLESIFVARERPRPR